MACEFLDEKRLVRCRAVEGILVPSHHERERYCRTDEPERCPTLRLYQLTRSPLTQEAYYSLWMPGDSPRSASAAAAHV